MTDAAGRKRSISRLSAMCAQEKPAADRSRRSRRVPARANRITEGGVEAAGNSDARRKLVDAAIQCILERGFYRASSNAIAEAAGVTWGVVQYHFGTREALMLAVLQDGSHTLADLLRGADIRGETLIERIEQYFDILAEYYASPKYLAYIQVLINLEHDPHTSEQTKNAMATLTATAQPELDRLSEQVLAGTGLSRNDLQSLLFHSLRGLSISHVMLGTIPSSPRGVHHDFLGERRLMARALSLFIEQVGETQE